MELDLSQDGRRLAWGATNDLPGSNNNFTYGYVMDLNPSGDYVTKRSYLIGSTLQNTVKGVEFNDAGNILFIGCGNQITASTGIKAINLTTNVMTSIPNSYDYDLSQIERGADGRMYVGQTLSTGAKIASFSQIAPYTFSTATSVNLQYYKYFIGSGYPDYYSTLLPDQLDGEDYEVLQNNLSPLTYDIGNLSISGVNNWASSTNPYNKSSLNISGTITVPSGGILAISNMTMNFSSSASIVVNGGVLFIDASTLQAINCSVMWPGIILQNGGILSVGYNYSSLPTDSYIKDAIKAINATGTTIKLDLNHCRFFANENDVYLSNVPATNFGNQTSFIANTLIRNCQFNHTTLLKDQVYGIEMNTVGSGKKGNTGIYIANTSNQIEIGPNNSFEAGYLGVNVFNSNVNVIGNNSFVNISGSLISASPCTAIKVLNNTTIKNVEIKTSNTFNRCQRGISTKGILTLKVLNNNFKNGWETSVSSTLNKGGDITISNNIFDFCNWEAINLFDNGNLNVTNTSLPTFIDVEYNNIANHPYASGIVIQELNQSSNLSFRKFIIKNNYIGQSPSGSIGQGIIIRNVLANEDAHTYKNDGSGDVGNNTIVYSTTLNPNYNGVYFENCKRVAMVYNYISGDKNNSNTNSGAFVNTSQESLISRNQFQYNGNGLRAVNNMNGSNYFCNTFIDNRNGINLMEGHILRPSGGLHGVCVTEGRENSFSGSLNSDINRTNIVDPARNQWVFLSGLLPSMTLQSVPSGIYTGTIVASCRGSQTCVATVSGSPVITDPWVDNSLPEGYRWGLQLKQMQEIIASDLPYDPASNFAKFINISDHIGALKYDSAQLILANLIPASQVENEYKTLLNLIVDANYPDERDYNSIEIDFIRGIALASSFNSGPHVFTARALLNVLTGENAFEPSSPLNDIVGFVNSSCTPSELLGKELTLVYPNGDPVPNVKGYIDAENYAYYFFGEQLSQLSPDLQLTIACNDANFQSPPVKSLFTWYNSIKSDNGITIQCLVQKLLKMDSSFNYTLFPNPSLGKINLKTNNKSNLSYKIISMQGQELKAQDIENNLIDITELNKGCYFIHIIDKNSGVIVKQDRVIYIND